MAEPTEHEGRTFDLDLRRVEPVVRFDRVEDRLRKPEEGLLVVARQQGLERLPCPGVGTGVRLFYVLLPENRAVLLDGMTKKREDIPDATMRRLRALQAAVNAELRKPKKGQ